MPETGTICPGLNSCPMSVISVLLCGQFLEREYGCSNHMTQGVQEQIGVLPAIETESHLVQIGREMFCADLMPRSDDTALQKTESVLDCVGVNIRSEAYIFLLRVIHRLMPIAQFAQSLGVGCQFIGHDHIHILRDIFLDISGQSSALCILGMEESQLAIALPNADHYLFVGRCFPAPWVSLLSTHIGFIHLDSTIQHGSIKFLHGGSNPMAEIPRGFIASADDALDLGCAHSFAGFAEQIRGNKPFSQCKVRVLKHSARDDRELVRASIALIAVVLLNPRVAMMLATWTDDTLRPAQPFKDFSAAIIRPKHFVQFKNRHRR